MSIDCQSDHRLLKLSYLYKLYYMHQLKVNELSKKLSKQKKSVLARSCSNTLRQGTYKKSCLQLDLRNFDKILEIGENYAWVEPKVTIYDLVTQTLKLGLIPAVVPEFKSITIGGAIMGAALESSSHRYGQFNDICLEYELLLGDGSVVTASANKHADLFYGISGSYGTLAVLTKAKVRLIKAKPYVALSYLLKFPEAKADFCDAVALAPGEICTIEAEMVDLPFYPLYQQKGSFFKHILSYPSQESMHLKEYLFRFDKGAFWMGRQIPFGMSIPSKFLYRGLHTMPQKMIANRFFIHDYYVPSEHAQEVFNTFSKETNIYPIWLCPIKGTTTPQFLAPHYGKKSFVNIGIYGKIKDSIFLSSKLERDILSFGGRKMLYSLTYYDEETFNKEYDAERYSLLRQKYHAEGAFPSLFNKVCQQSIPLKTTISEIT